MTSFYLHTEIRSYTYFLTFLHIIDYSMRLKFSSKKRNNQKDEEGDEPPPSKKTRKFRKYFAGGLSILVFMSSLQFNGNILNNVGGNYVMAGPRRKEAVRVGVAKETLSHVRKMGTQAGSLYEKYILTGNEKLYLRYKKLWNLYWANQQNRLVKEHFFKSFLKRCGTADRRSKVKLLFNAFVKDRAIPGKAVLEAIHHSDFVDTVYRIRKALKTVMHVPFVKGLTEKRMKLIKLAIDRRAVLIKSHGSKIVKEVEAIIEKRPRGKKLTTAEVSSLARKLAGKYKTSKENARSVISGVQMNAKVLEGVSRTTVSKLTKIKFILNYKKLLKTMEDIASKYGVRLGRLVYAKQPRENAKMAAKFVFSFLEGDSSAGSQFERIYKRFQASKKFTDALKKQMMRKPLKPIVKLYLKKAKTLDPMKFYQHLKKFLTALQSKPKAQLEKAFGSRFVNTVVDVVVYSLAKKAGEIYFKALRGNVAASKELQKIFSMKVYGKPIDEHKVFAEEFMDRYKRATPVELANIFKKYSFAIAAREVFMAGVMGVGRLQRRYYNPRFVDFVLQNLEKLFPHFVRNAQDIKSILKRRAVKDATLAPLLKLGGKRIRELYKLILINSALRIKYPPKAVDRIAYNFKRISRELSDPRVGKKAFDKYTTDTLGVSDVEAIFNTLKSIRDRIKGVDRKAIARLARASFLLKPVDDIQGAVPPFLAKRKGFFFPTVPSFVRAFAAAEAFILRGKEYEAVERFGRAFTSARRAALDPQSAVDYEKASSIAKTLRLYRMSINSALKGLRKTMNRYRVFKYVKKDIVRYTQVYRRKVEKELAAFRKARTKEEKKAIMKRLDHLSKGVIRSGDVRYAVRLAASFLHYMEGGTGVTYSEVSRLIFWFRNAEKAKLVGKMKAKYLEKIMLAVIKKMDPTGRAYAFIQKADTFTSDRGVVYAAYRKYKSGKINAKQYKSLRKRLVGKYGEKFFLAVEQNFEQMRYLDEPTQTFFQYSLLRVLRGLRKKPKSDEGKLRLIYGDEVVNAVKERMSILSGVKKVSDIRKLSPAMQGKLRKIFEKRERTLNTKMLRGAYRQEKAVTRIANVAEYLPGVFSLLQNALVMTADPTQLRQNVALVRNYFRDKFGENASEYPIDSIINRKLLTRLNRSYFGATASEISFSNLHTFLGKPQIIQGIREGVTILDDFITTYTTYGAARGIITDADTAAIDQLRKKFTVIDALYLREFYKRRYAGFSMTPKVKVAILRALLKIQERDPYLIGPFLMRVLPTFTRVCDESTIQPMLEKFVGIITSRYAKSLRDIAFSTGLKRRYFLKYFEAIEKKLTIAGKAYTHRQLYGDLMHTGTPVGTTKMYKYPFGRLYKRKLTRWAKPPYMVPEIAARNLATLDMTPPIKGTFTPGLYWGGDVSVSGGASDRHASMAATLKAPMTAMPSVGVPATLKIGVLSAATLMRRLEQLAGPMREEYSNFLTLLDISKAAYGAGVQVSGTKDLMYGAGAQGILRTPTGGMMYRATGGATESETVTEAAGGDPIKSKRKTANFNLEELNAGGVTMRRVPVLGKIPVFGKADIHSLDAGLTYGQTWEEKGGKREVIDKSIQGTLESYSTIARKKGVDMYVFVTGRYNPELKAGEPRDVVQEKLGKLETRLYVVTKEGDIYQVACGRDTEVDMLNYLFGEADHNNVLASLRYMGRKMFKNDLPMRGFDGMAVGFTIAPKEKLTLAGLAAMNVVRPFLESSEPEAQLNARYYLEHSAALAVTYNFRKSQHVYAAFLRGSEKVGAVPTAGPVRRGGAEVAPPGSPFVGSGVRTKREWTSWNIEAMWRRMPKPREKERMHAMEAGAIVGSPSTFGGRWMHEIPLRYKRRIGYGVIAGRTVIDLLKEMPMIDQEAMDIYTKVKTTMVSVYGWEEKKAMQMGWFAAFTYMHSKLSDYVATPGTEVTKKKLNPNFFSFLMMYWAKRHKLLVGFETLPGYAQINTAMDRVDDAMQQLADPAFSASHEAILRNLAETLKEQLQRRVWKVALAWGYDGEKVKLCALGGGVKSFEETYGSLRFLLGFGSPIKWYIEVMGAAYKQAPLMVTEELDEDNNITGITTSYGEGNPYADLYFGIGAVNWPRLNMRSYSSVLKLTEKYVAHEVIKDCFLELLKKKPDFNRLASAYGNEFVAAMQRNGEDLGWMLRKPAQIAKTLSRLIDVGVLDPQEDLGLKKKYTKKDLLDTAKNLRKVITQLYNPRMNRVFLVKHRKLVKFVKSRRPEHLAWIIRPDLKKEISRRKGVRGLSDARMPTISRKEITPVDIVRLINRNKRAVIAAHLGIPRSMTPPTERFAVTLAAHLRGQKHTPQKAYYLLIDTKVGQLYVGDITDYRNWMKKNKWFLGSKVRRLQVSKKRGKYIFKFSGDRGKTWFGAWKVLGGVTVPLERKILDDHKFRNNWTVGGLLEVLKTNKWQWLAGFVVGRRQYGREFYDQFSVIPVSAAFREYIENAQSKTHHFYVAVNWAKRKIKLLTPEELPSFQRGTVALGYQYAKVNMVDSTQWKIDLYGEAGGEKGKYLLKGTNTFSPKSEREFVGRVGASVEYTPDILMRQWWSATYKFGFAFEWGNFPTTYGTITNPTTLGNYFWQLQSGSGLPTTGVPVALEALSGKRRWQFIFSLKISK